ncbi:hypothetical protein BC830DRAFT_1166298 [Chytriomyces sp. MP71]|nr:hypothetical protein BC830DRAFT_1166298 [Chytriomyces sp. MP71]
MTSKTHQERNGCNNKSNKRLTVRLVGFKSIPVNITGTAVVAIAVYSASNPLIPQILGASVNCIDIVEYCRLQEVRNSDSNIVIDPVTVVGKEA